MRCRCTPSRLTPAVYAPRMSLVEYAREGGVAQLTLNLPPANCYSYEMMRELDAAVLEAAYDDAAGVTAAFNLNLLARINRELKANFALDQFRHRAVYRPEIGRVEMQLVSLKDQVVQIREAGLKVSFREGETIHTENSHKYTQERLQGLASVAGFVEEARWSDPKGWFQVQRWRPVVG